MSYPEDPLVGTDAIAVDETPSKACLLIHTDAPIGVSGKRVESLVQWLRARLWHGPRPKEEAILSVQIDDLRGVRVFAIDNAGPLISVPPMAPGAYHVTARQGELQRRYTMALPQGAPSHLHLHVAHGRARWGRCHLSHG